jgi:flagellar L-ring protein precursor FlgH
MSSVCKLLIIAALTAANILCFLSQPASALPKFKRNKPQGPSALDSYLTRARAMSLPAPATTGSLWVASGPLAALSADFKARNPGDTLVIHLVDNFSAATNGENKQSRQFDTKSSLTGLLGTLATRNRLQNLFAGNSATNLDGKGQSSLSSNLSLNLAAQVIEVLPNGMLVVQAARDIAVGNDRQTVYLRGIVRPGDIAPDNSISSSSISSLEAEIKGKGAVAEITRQPNIVIRTMLKILTF